LINGAGGGFGAGGRTWAASRWAPTPGRLIEAGFVLAVTLLGLAGFAASFDSWWFLAVAAIGTGLALVLTHVVLALRWHWTLAVAGAIGVYCLVGGPVAVRYDLIAGVVPSLATERDLVTLATTGWKAFLTAYPPVDGAGEYLALPFLLALVGAAASYGLARAYRFLSAGLIPQTGLFGLVIALGTHHQVWPVYQGLAWVAVVVAWLAYRARSATRLLAAEVTHARPARILAGVGLLGLALVAGLVAGPGLPGMAPVRDILRDHVDLPVDLTKYPSPMSSLRKFSSVALKDTFYYDDEILTVTGAAPGALLRFAVLDSYDGWVWGASSSGFRQVGRAIPVPAGTTGTPVELGVTIGAVYAAQTPLDIWIPSLGPATAIEFGAADGRSRAGVAYDLTKGQGLLLDQVRAGETFAVTSVPVAEPQDGVDYEPAGAPLVSLADTEFLVAALGGLTGGDLAPWAQLETMAAGFRKGGWSDGTGSAAEARYSPGDGQDRLKAFLATLPRYAGSDEQYAALFALVANRIGFPARVVFGAVMPKSGTAVRGADVHIWVEVSTTAGWLALGPDFFIPPRDQRPEPPPPEETPPPEAAEDIPPANPKPPPEDVNSLDTQAVAGKPAPPPVPPVAAWWLPVAAGVAAGVAGLVLLVGLLVAVKGGRTWWRYHHGTPVQQIAAGWADLVDRARDVGLPVRGRQTRRELAAALGQAGMAHVATLADRAMFQPTPPDRRTVETLWAEVRQAKRDLLFQKRGLPRLWARLTPRSLTPRRR
jgi:hypothetical protein